MAQFVRNFLRDEDHASKVLIEGAVAIMVVGFLIAVAAIVWMR